MALRPAGIHAIEHLRPVLRLGPAGSCMEGHDRIVCVVLPSQQRGKLLGFQHLFEPLHIRECFWIDALVFLLVAQLDQGQGVLIEGRQIVITCKLRFDFCGLKLVFLGFFHIIPKPRHSGFLFKLGQLALKPLITDRLPVFLYLVLACAQTESQLFKLQHTGAPLLIRLIGG